MTKKNNKKLCVEKSVEKHGDLINNEEEPVTIFNKHCINIVEKPSDKKPLPIGSSSDVSNLGK